VADTQLPVTIGAASLTLRKLAKGQILIHEGDPADAIYVICSGSLRVSRRDLTAIDSVVELATVGTGDVIGELGPILGQVRSASVEALEPTQVLHIPADQLSDLAQQHQPLLRVMAIALRERAGLPDAAIAQTMAKLGLIVPSGSATDTQTGPGGSPALPVPGHDPTLCYPKAVDCPSCGMRFSALTFHMRKNQPAERESDFHNTYRSSYNPYDYEIWVCPNDLYAALPPDFPNLAEQHRLQVAPVVETVVADWGDQLPDFNVDRTPDLRERALALALALYRMRDLPHARIAAITHRFAWAARERGDVEAENQWLASALEHYSTAYSEADLGGPKEELRIQYLCGELSLRLGDMQGAITWFAQALRHPALKEHAIWERMLREQWAVAREKMASQEASV
jgi:uncharacterized protein (DUF2225 family)